MTSETEHQEELPDQQDRLRTIFCEITGDGSVIERQDTGPPRYIDPNSDTDDKTPTSEYITRMNRSDGLDDAIGESELQTEYHSERE